MKRVNAGFTLLEVLIALVILAIGFTAASLTLNASINNIGKLQDKTAAQWVGLNVIAKAQTGMLSLPKNSSPITGSDSMFDTTWFWDLTAQPNEDKTILRITVNVKKEMNSHTLIQLTSYLMADPS